MRHLFAIGLFWSSVACCLVAQVLIIRSVRGARHLPPGAAGLPRRRGTLELVWAVVPAVGLAILLFFTWRAIQRAGGPAPAAAPTHGSPRMPA